MYNKQLETFVRVAEVGSFTKAAETLYISPPAVIKQINQLEASFELQLFVRSHRGLTITEAGESLLRDAKYMIGYAKESLTRAQNAVQSDESIVRIGSSHMTPTQFLIDMWPKIHAQCPKLKFSLVPFENTPENAREILMNLGRNIDVVAGIYDDVFLAQRKCAVLELARESIHCAVPIGHRLAGKEQLSVCDLFGEKLMLIKRGWNGLVDALRDDLAQNYPEITIVDFPFYDVSVYNQCENEGNIMMANVTTVSAHPLLKIMPVDWDHEIPFGLLHSPSPSRAVQSFLGAVSKVYGIS